jgi:hypothetical protein
MTFLFSLILPTIVCILVVGTTATLWWKVLTTPWTFVIFGFLTVLGLHRVIQALVEFIKIFTHGGYFLEYQARPNAIELLERSINIETVAITITLALTSLCFLYWLRSLLSR